MAWRKKKKREHAPMGGLDLTGQAMHLVRTAPCATIVGYCIGTFPFMLGALYFWMDMSQSAFAADRCLMGSLVLAGLFLWMKCWHTVYACGLRAHLAGLPPPRWTARRIGRMTVTQLAVQPHGLWLLPLALILLFPFHGAYAFFQNMGLMGNGGEDNLKTLTRRAQKQAWIWPSQNWVSLWLLCPWILAAILVMCFGTTRLAMSSMSEFHHLRGAIWFGASLILIVNFMIPFCPFSGIVAGNIALMIALAPFLLHTWFGIETAFTRGSIHSLFNSTFLMTVYILSFLCLDPVMRAGYVIRCFHGEAQTTGDDLICELREESLLTDLTGGSA